MVFVGILFNRQDYRELGSKIDKLAAQQHSDMMMISVGTPRSRRAIE